MFSFNILPWKNVISVWNGEGCKEGFSDRLLDDWSQWLKDLGGFKNDFGIPWQLEYQLLYICLYDEKVRYGLLIWTVYDFQHNEFKYVYKTD